MIRFLHRSSISSSCSYHLRNFVSHINKQPVKELLIVKNGSLLFNNGKGKLFQRNFWNGPTLDEGTRKLRIKSTLYYLAALGVFTVGASYAAVPLYRIFCAVSNL